MSQETPEQKVIRRFNALQAAILNLQSEATDLAEALAVIVTKPEKTPTSGG